MDKDQVNKILNEVLVKNCDPAQAEIMKNIMSNFLNDISQKDLDDLESKFKTVFKESKKLKGKSVFD